MNYYGVIDGDPDDNDDFVDDEDQGDYDDDDDEEEQDDDDDDAEAGDSGGEAAREAGKAENPQVHASGEIFFIHHVNNHPLCWNYH